MKECKFIGPKTIVVSNNGDDDKDQQNTMKADKILIAACTRPRIPNIQGLVGSGYITTDETLRLKKTA